MNETPDTEAVGKPVAVTLGVGLLAAFAFVTGQAFSDGSRRVQIEAVAEVTAVGDTAYSPVPAEPAPPYPAAAKLDGHPLYPVSAKPARMDETEMRRVGRDAAAGLTVYEAGPKAAKSGEAAGSAGRFYFLKVGPGQFLKVGESPQPPAKP